MLPLILNGGTGEVIITDTWQSTLTRTLPNNVENLKLIGINNINGTGNNGNNIITGNSGNNQINGGNGADILTGGLGADTLHLPIWPIYHISKRSYHRFCHQ
jgi:Ca2+-binding RTX toxin-like protein